MPKPWANPGADTASNRPAGTPAPRARPSSGSTRSTPGGSPFFSARERAAPTLTETVTPVRDGQVPDAVYAEAVEVFEEEQIAALIWAATVINAYNRIAIATPTVPGAGSFYGAGSNEAQEMCLIRSGVCRRGSPNAEGR